LLAVLAAFGACTDRSTVGPEATPAATTAPAAPASAPSVAAPALTWLAPLGTGAADPATFDAGAAPVVEVCAWTGAACAAAPVARFTTMPAGTDLPLTVDAAAGRYEAAWGLMDASFRTRATYRIRVLHGATELGAVSVDVVRGRWALTSPASPAPLHAAVALTIRFGLSAAPADELTPEQTIAALDALEGESNRLRAIGLRGEPYLDSLVRWIAGRPEFDGAGATTDGAWAQLRDGTPIAIEHHADDSDVEPAADGLAERAPVDRPRLAAFLRNAPRRAAEAFAAPRVAHGHSLASADPSPEFVELPWSQQARVAHIFGRSTKVYEALGAAADEMGRLLEDANYKVGPTEHLAGIQYLAGVDRDGFFALFTHGGFLRDGTYVLGTADRPTLESENDFSIKAAKRAGQIVIGFFDYWDEDGQFTKSARHYAITPAFVRAHMSFAPSSMVLLNACNGAHPGARPMVEALHAKNASTVLTWTRTAGIYRTWPRSSIYLMDRLLGANVYVAERPPQRPFGVTAVLVDMARRGLDRDAPTDKGPGTGARLVPRTAPASSIVAGILRPSIMWQYISRDDDPPGVCTGTCNLTLLGEFGLDARPDAGVSMNYEGTETPLPIVRWPAPGQVVVRIPATGPGSVGDVVLTSRGRSSTPRRIHRWDGVLKYTEVRDGALRLTVEIDLKARFDGDAYRLLPGIEPGDPFGIGFLSPLPGQARYTASGELTEDFGRCRQTTRWRGSGSVDNLPGSDLETGFYGLVNTRIRADRRVLEFHPRVYVSGRSGAIETVTLACPEGSSTEEHPLGFSIAGFDGSHNLPLDATLSIRSGSLDGRGLPAGIVTRLQWDAIPATPPASDTQPR
jgi:hypothetical protein